MTRAAGAILERDVSRSADTTGVCSAASGQPPIRRVLMICAAFPPTGGPGVQRSSKFARYLPCFGWTPTVWTTVHLPQLPRDESLAADLPEGLDVRRTAVPAICTSDTTRHWRWRRVRRVLAECMVPDPLVGWARRSFGPLSRLLADEPIDAIYSTFSPPSAHLLGRRLQRAIGVPWIADFRDLWTDDYAYAAPRWRRMLDRRIENTLLRSADRVVAVTDAQRDILADHAPDRCHRFVTITNGVDLADLPSADDEPVRAALHGPADRFVLLFCGWFLSDRVPDALVGGLRRFAAWCRSQDREPELRIVGAIGASVRDRMAASDVRVVTTGYVPHDAALRHMRAADALLLLVPTAGTGYSLIPGKCFEYIAANRPIVLIGPPDGQAARYVRQFDAGVVSPPHADDIAVALDQVMKRGARAVAPMADPVRLQAISRRNLTGQLADVLNEVVEQRRRTTP